jgi:hypothetical protein
MNAVTMTSISSKRGGNKIFRNNTMVTHKAQKNNISNAKRVIVQYDENTAGFVEDGYIEMYLGRYITEQEFDEIISYCSKKMQKFWMFVKENDKEKFPRSFKIMSVLIITFMVIYIVGIFIVLGMSTIKEYVYYMSFICLMSGVSISIAMNVYNHFRSYKKFKSPSELLKDDLDEYFKTVNPKFPEIEFSYNINKNWIEVDIVKYRDDDHSSYHSEKPKRKEK